MGALKSEALLEALKKSFEDPAKSAQAKKANSVFQIDVKGADGSVAKSVVIDLKGNAQLLDKAPAGKKVDATITIADGDLIDLATGKTTGQKAFSTGKLKVKGNVMAVMKIEGILKAAAATAKL